MQQGTGVIDNFLAIFTQYIDSGFGLVQGDVHWLAGVLIAIDITLAGLFWALAPDEDVLARLIRKTLFIGLFAFIIGNFNGLARIIYESFAGLGIEAGGGHLTQAQLLQPGRLAQVGIDAGKPILTSISSLVGFVAIFNNAIQIAVLLIAWLIVVISFFVMAIQLFVALIEFKLTTLAGFVLVPFGLFGRTAFLAEKVHRKRSLDNTRAFCQVLTVMQDGHVKNSRMQRAVFQIRMRRGAIMICTSPSATILMFGAGSGAA